MVQIASRVLTVVAAICLAPPQAAGLEDFPRTIVGFDDGSGGLELAMELSLHEYRPLGQPRQHGDFLVDIDVQPDSAEEMILLYVHLLRNGDASAAAGLIEPAQRRQVDGQPCNCSAGRQPYHRIPETFRSISFQYAWLFENYRTIWITFLKSDRSSTHMPFVTRRHEGRVYIAAQPDDAAYQAASYLLRPNSHRSQPPTSVSHPGQLDHSVHIQGGANPIIVHFDGTLHSPGAGWQPASQSRPADRVAAYAAEVLATVGELDDDAFLELFHPNVSSAARSLSAGFPGFLDELRDRYSVGSNIAHVFTIKIGRSYGHGYLTQAQPDRLRSMVIEENGRDLALAGIPPDTGLESLMAVDSLQQYLLDLWRSQN